MRLTRILPALIGVVLLVFAPDELDSQELDSLELAEKMRLVGDSLYLTGNYTEALVQLDESLKLFSILGADSSVARVLNVMAYNYWFLSLNDSAVDSFQRALLSAKKSKVEREIARVSLGLGNYYRFEHRNDTALTHFRNALRSVEKSEENLSRIEASVLSGIGNVFIDRQNSKYFSLDSALKYYSRALRLIEGKEEFERTYSEVISNVAIVYEEKGLLDSAINYNLISLQIARSQNNSEGEAVSLFNIGNIKLDQNDYNESLTYYLRSDSIAESMGDLVLRKNISRNIAQVYLLEGKARETELYVDRFDSLLEVIYNDRRAEALGELETKYGLLELQAENTRNELALSKSRRTMNTIIIFFIAALILVVIWIYFNEQKKKALQDIALKNEQLANQKINDLLQQQEINSLQGVLAGQEGERQRIATDLHDKLGAILGMVKLHFSAVEDRIDDLRDDNKKQYNKANELLDQASTEVRNISHNLLSGVLVKFGLVPALQDLKDTVEATGKLKVQFIPGDQMEVRLSGEQELQLYRIVQELISNILKHAKATEAVIQLNRTNGVINLIVEDNGVGFDVEVARKKEGIGLKNLEARAAKLNAKLHFDSGKGAGTTVSIDIPIKEASL